MATYNLEDPINVLELARKNQYDGDFVFKGNDVNIKNYIDYLKFFVDEHKAVVVKDDAKHKSQVDPNEDFKRAFKAIIKHTAKNTTLDLKAMLSLIDKLEQNNQVFTKAEFDFLMGTSTSSLKQFLDSFALPLLNEVDLVPSALKQHKGLQEVLSGAKTDKTMKRKIKRAWEIAHSDATPTHLRGMKKRTFVHGTTNQALISILGTGFRVMNSNDVRKSGASFSGRMFGDGIYFARPDQVSKTQAYQENNSQIGQNWIIIADVYYNDIEQGHDAKKGNIRWEKGVGMYSRDEIIAQPSQIVIRYVAMTD